MNKLYKLIYLFKILNIFLVNYLNCLLIINYFLLIKLN